MSRASRSLVTERSVRAVPVTLIEHHLTGL
jgi:hypothetical protein